MPTSRPNAIPTVVHVVRQLDPESILDVGVGFGKWGLLFREYSDIRLSEDEPSRYHRAGWKVRIEGIEGFPDYLTPVHDYVYDRIHRGLAQDLVPGLGEYDVVHVGDMIEHLSKEDGIALLTALLAKARKALIVSTPKYDTHQSEHYGNELERHRSVWSKRDFERFPGANVRTVAGTLLIAVILKPGVPLPRIRASLSGAPRGLAGLRARVPELVARGLDRLRGRTA
jgi:hypothetical protein